MNAPASSSLIEDGAPLVRSLALRIRRDLPLRVELEDLIAYGFVGLMEAARDFRPGQGCQFSTFAYYRIRGAIYDGVAKMSWTTRGMYRKLRREQALVASGRENGVQQDGGDAANLEAAAVRSEGPVAPVAARSEELGGVYEVHDHAAPPSKLVADREILQRLDGLVAALDPLQRKLLRDVYFEGASLQEAAVRLGISKSWASRTHAKALADLARTLQQWGAAEL